MIDVSLLARWGASDPVAIADTPTSRVARVSLARGGTAVIKHLKPIGLEDGLRGAAYLAWRDGRASVNLLARGVDALLLEDAGDESVIDYLGRNGDAAATAVLLATLAELHAPSAQPAEPSLQTLDERFASLFDKADADRRRGAETLFVEAAGVARRLVDDQRDAGPLHGDMHHENVIRSPRGWLAIDPHGLVGDPAYDAANLFYNPVDRDDLRTDPARIRSMARAASDTLDRDPVVVLSYGFAHACLSASWHLEDGNPSKAARSLGVASAIRAVRRPRAPIHRRTVA